MSPTPATHLRFATENVALEPDLAWHERMDWPPADDQRPRTLRLPSDRDQDGRAFAVEVDPYELDLIRWQCPRKRTATTVRRAGDLRAISLLGYAGPLHIQTIAELAYPGERRRAVEGYVAELHARGLIAVGKLRNAHRHWRTRYLALSPGALQFAEGRFRHDGRPLVPPGLPYRTPSRRDGENLARDLELAAAVLRLVHHNPDRIHAWQANPRLRQTLQPTRRSPAASEDRALHGIPTEHYRPLRPHATVRVRLAHSTVPVLFIRVGDDTAHLRDQLGALNAFLTDWCHDLDDHRGPHRPLAVLVAPDQATRRTVAALAQAVLTGAIGKPLDPPTRWTYPALERTVTTHTDELLRGDVCVMPLAPLPPHCYDETWGPEPRWPYVHLLPRFTGSPTTPTAPITNSGPDLFADAATHNTREPQRAPEPDRPSDRLDSATPHPAQEDHTPKFSQQAPPEGQEDQQRLPGF
ncbi:MAG TPA: hypothetical protein VF196_03830 [Casimicrobiaceae bacterium]